MKKEVFKILKQKKQTLSLVESCTGGGLCKDFVLMPGASEVLRGGLVAYQDFTKENVLGVSKKTLKEHGAVSKECAGEMSKLGAKFFQSDYCLITTGYVGPGSGTGADPVGTIYFAVWGKRSECIERRTFPESNDRSVLIESAIEYAWEVLHRELLQEIK